MYVPGQTESTQGPWPHLLLFLGPWWGLLHVFLIICSLPWSLRPPSCSARAGPVQWLCPAYLILSLPAGPVVLRTGILRPPSGLGGCICICVGTAHTQPPAQHQECILCTQTAAINFIYCPTDVSASAPRSTSKSVGIGEPVT